MRLVYTTFLIVAMSALRLWAQDSCISNTISLNVSSKPMVSISGATTICSGGSATLQATTTGGIGICQLQWQKSEDNGVTYQDILGENTKTLQTKNLAKTTFFRALYNCDGVGCSSKPSDPQIVSVVDKPLVSISPNQLSICQNTPLAITASVSGGSGVPTYQWQSSTNGLTWTDIPGETASVYANNNLTQSNYFRVVVTEQGDGCIVFSTPVQISVDGCTGAIGDYVWLDCNNNGIQDGDEKGLTGITITLNGTTSAGKSVTQSTTSNVSGFYLFSNLQAGTYIITFGLPSNISGLIFTAKNAGNSLLDSDADPSGKTDPIVLKAGETRTDIDAGFSESQGPVFTSIPKNITVNCDAIPVAAIISATDIFGASTIVDGVETKSVASSTCPSAYTLTRKWTAKDNCGKVTTATQIITVQDTTAPVFTFVPADVTISCHDPIPNGADVRVTDNCALMENIQRDQIEREPRRGCANRIIHRTWTAKDSCGNTSVAKQTITIKDSEAPVFVNVPQNTTVQCDNVPPIESIIITAQDNCDANPVITSSPPKITFGRCNGSYISTRTWTATDGCGNASTYTQILTVEDTIKPVVVQAPTDITVDLSKGETIPSAPIIGTDVVATDNCDANPIIQSNEIPKVPIGNCKSLLQRTWTAIDNCGNRSTRTQNITILEAQPIATISLNTPETCTGNDGQINLSPTNLIYRWSDGGSGATRNNLTAGTYSVTVVSSATCSAVQQVTMTRVCVPCTPPILSVAKKDVSCGGTSDGTATITITNGSINDYKFIWTPTVSTTNSANNLSKGIYSLRVEKLSDPTCFATTQFTINNTPDVNIADATIVNAGCTLLTGSATFNTNGDTAYKFIWDDGNTQSSRNNLAVGNYKVTISHDGQCDIVKQVQIISTGNKPVVTISAAPLYICANTKVDFNAIGNVAGNGTLTYQWQSSEDNGATWVNISGATSAVYSNSTISKTTLFRVQVSTSGDGCFTLSTPVKITVDACSGAIGDFVWLDCNNNGLQDGGEKGLSNVPVTLNGTDLDGNPVSKNTSTDASGFYLFNNLLAGTYTVNFGTPLNINGLTFTTKNAGNTNLDSDADASGKTDAIILKAGETRTDIDAGFIETQGPVFTSVPKNITVNCEAIPVAQTLAATDIFSTPVLVTDPTETKSPASLNCPSAYTLTRKWTAKDNCGKVTTATQIITVQDTTAPVFTFVPKDVTISCKDPIPNGADVRATDNCGLDGIITKQISDTKIGCSNQIIHRTYTATDLCGNVSVAYQTITVKDSEAPVFVNVPQNTTVQCNNVPPIESIIVTAKDNCDANPLVTSSAPKITAGRCNGSYISTRTWTAIDGCGNASTYTQILTVEDTIKPIIVQVPDDITIDLTKGETIPTAPILYRDIVATDNCDVNPIIQPNTLPQVSIGNCKSLLQRTWTAIDNCGNRSTRTQNITILEAQPVATISLNSPETCAGNDGQISLSPSNIIYKWSDGGSGATRNNLTAGTYSLTVVGSTTCSAVQQVTMSKVCVPCTSPILSVSKTDVSCGKINDGTATITITNGNINDYKFIWTPTVSTTNTANNLSKGTYNLRVEKLSDPTCFALTQLSILTSPDVVIADPTIVNAGCNSTTGSATFNTNGDAAYKFIWDDGNTQSTRNNLAVGNYRVTVSHAAQCDIVKQVQIISEGTKPVVTIVVNTPENCTDRNGVIQFTPANLVYRWNDGVTGSTRNNLSAGDYTVSVYSTPTCFIEQKITVGRNCITCLTPIVSIKTTDQSCSRNNDGKAVVTISNSNIADYKFIWSAPVSNSNTADNLVPGDYTVRVEKLSDPTCFTSTTFKINPAIDVVIDTPTIANANCNTNGSIYFNANLNYTFVWNDNDTNRIRTNLVAGNYTVTVSRVGQCSITKSFVITKTCVVPTDSCKTPIASLTKIDQSCVFGSVASATININNGNVSDYTFTWTPNVSITNTANNLPVGSYSVKIVKNNLTTCDTTIKFTIDGATKLLVDAPIIKPADCVSPTGSIDYTNPANIGLKFRWNDLDTNRLRTKLTTGLYVVTITDPKTNRCPFTDSITVPNNNPLHTSSEIRSQPSCGKPNGYVKLATTGGSGQYIYSWGEGDSRFVLPAGITTVTTTDVQSGCKTTVTFNLINQNIEATLVLDTLAQLTCNGSADGRVNYSVTPGRGFVYPISIEIHDTQNRIVTNGALQAGKYVFQVKDSTGCVAVERNFSVTQPDALSATFSKRSLTCDTLGSVTFKISGGRLPYKYLWSDANGFTTDNATRNDLQPGTYSVTVLDAGSCLLPIKNIGILDSCPCRLPVIDSIASTPATCGASNGGGKIFLRNTLNINKYQFDWTPAIGNANAIGNERTSLAGGVYSVIISERSNPNCFINANIGIGSLQGPKNITVVTNPASCEAANGSATLSPAPADSLTYTWLIDNSNSNVRNDLKAGFYQVLVSKNNLPDCPTLINVQIGSQNNLSATVEISKKATCGLTNGVATIHVTGGSDVYTYKWSSGGTSDVSRNNLSGGVYSVTITDIQTKCTSILTFTMQNEVIGQTTVELTDSIVYTYCVGSSDAQVSFKINSSQLSALSYQLLDGSTGKIIGDSSRLIAQSSLLISNLNIGRYCIVVRDANKCIAASKCFEVKNPLPLLAVATKVNRTCDVKGIINIAVTGGTGTYSYQWSDNPTILSALRSDLDVGSYRVTVTDSNGCNIILDTLNIRNDCSTNPVCSFGGSNNNVSTTIQNADCTKGGSIILTINGGIAPYKFDWLDLTGVNNPQNRTDLKAGNYTVTVTDATGCKDTLQNIIVKNSCDTTNTCTPPSITNISVNEARCGIASGSINISSSELSAISYQLSVINNNVPTSVNFKLSADGLKLIADSLRAGLYHVKISRSTYVNCFIERDIIVKNIDGLKIATPATTPATCAASNGTAQFTSGGGALQFNWSDGKTGFSRNDLAAGQYFVTITDPTKNYCDQIISVEIKSTNTISATTTLDIQASCGRNDGQATVRVSGGSGIYNYSWGTSATRNDLSANNYPITVTDAVTGCTAITSVTMTNAASSSATINLSSNLIYTSCAGTNDASVVFDVTYSANFSQPAKVEIKNANGNIVSKNNLGIGKYSIQISDATGCLITASNFEVRSPNLIIASVQTKSQTCTQLGSISLSVSGGTGIYQLRITNNELRIDSIITVNHQPSTINQLRSGTYQITISDSRNCSVVLNNISVSNDSMNCGNKNCALSISSQIKNKDCTTGGSIILTATVGSGKYSYTWNDGVKTAARQNLNTGIYSVIVYDSVNLCFDTLTNLIVKDICSPTTCNVKALATVVDKTCDANGSISIAVTSGQAPFVFDWTDLQGANDPQNRTNLKVGNYSLIIMDATGCKDTLSNIIVKDICSPTTCGVKALATVIDKTCNANGSISITVTAGQAPFVFDWTDLLGVNDPQNRTNLSVGNYSIIITDATGCKDTLSNIIVKDICSTTTCTVKGNATVANKTCTAQGSIIVSVNGGKTPFVFDWADLPGTNNPQNRNDLQAGTYTLIVSDATGCKDTLTNLIVKDNCTIGATCDLKGHATIINKTCDAQGSIVVNVSGGKAPFVFDWVDLPGTNNPQNRFDVGAGVFTLIITDANGCKDTMSNVVVLNDCNGSSGCEKPIIASVTTVDSRCALGLGSAKINTSDTGLVYRWSPNVSTSASATNLIAGIYSVKIMHGTDTTCLNQQTIIIKNIDAVQINAPIITPATCATSNGGADFGNTNGLIFNWSDGKTGATRNDLAKGTYTVTISDATKTHCDQVFQVVIPASNNTISVTTTVTKQPACGRNDGQATVSVFGGSGTYQLRIANYELRIDSLITGLTSQRVYELTNLSAGNYLFTITDAVSGCTSTATLSVTNAAASSATINLLSNLIYTNCSGGKIASVNYSVTYSNDFKQPSSLTVIRYSLTGDVISKQKISNNELTNLTAGKYAIQVLDATNCLIASKAFEVASPSPISAEIQTQAVSCTTRGRISLIITGGSGTYQLRVTNEKLRIDSLVNGLTNQRINELSNLSSGNYAITISDANACQLVLDSIKVANDSVNCTPTPIHCASIFGTQNNYTVACGEKANICTTLNQTDTLNYKIYDNGVLYKNGFSQCKADTSVSYTYFTLVQKNPNGPWLLDEWLLNGQLHRGTFTTIQSLADSMNVWDAPKKWQLDTKTYSIYSLGNTGVYNKMLWSKNGLPIAELNPSVYEQYRRYGIKLDSGLHTLFIANTTLGCSDTVKINVETQCIATLPCGKLIENSPTTVSVVCGEKANICTKLSGADTLIYKVYDNGNLYAGGFTKCRADTSVSYNYFTFILSSANGPWTLNEWLVNGQLHKGIFNSIQSLVDSMNVWDAPNKWQLDAKSFTIYSDGNKNICNNMFWSKNSKPIAQLMSSYYEVYRQVGIKLNVGAHQIIFENPTLHCRDTAQINVKCFPFVGGIDHVEAKIKNTYDSVVVKIPRIDSSRIKAVNDHAVAFQYQTVQIEPMLNDTLHGQKAVIVLVEPPTYGRAVLNQARGVVAYTPQEDPCEKRDSFRYALVTANARDTAWITIEVVCDDLIVFTGFSPNQDGINDYFVIKGLENYKNNRLMVYNRFGNLVYETKNYQNDWAGTYNGQNLPDGTYFYLIDLGNGDQKSGYVQIQR